MREQEMLAKLEAAGIRDLTVGELVIAMKAYKLGRQDAIDANELSPTTERIVQAAKEVAGVVRYLREKRLPGPALTDSATVAELYNAVESA
jgi:hypothetical protein